ncbi:unnamed protein product [Acanthoscelides obtectus]|uniref:BESS domain-containing protein n=1 Tax=Acanthoscelides obtectus TaxID=200917 RepID=A0A9P0NW74_ACAOB|nr:unnamed protein product [Acanthoscelides obtectus]CAK1679233.1 hypothetical protein AOBTE_LOCUS32180 [Acanthoscelides obtectus]
MKAPKIPSRKGDDLRKKKELATSINDINQQAYQYFEKKQKVLEIQNVTKTNTTVDPPDPDLAFLHSVLPDIKSMKSNQKRRFKMGILNLAEQILSSTSLEATTPPMDGSQSWVEDSVNRNPGSISQTNNMTEFIRYNN